MLVSTGDVSSSSVESLPKRPKIVSPIIFDLSSCVRYYIGRGSFRAERGPDLLGQLVKNIQIAALLRPMGKKDQTSSKFTSICPLSWKEKRRASSTSFSRRSRNCPPSTRRSVGTPFHTNDKTHVLNYHR